MRMENQIQKNQNKRKRTQRSAKAGKQTPNETLKPKQRITKNDSVGPPEIHNEKCV